MSSHLAGKNYIVTGASRGIGLAAAHALGRRGARVALFGRDAAALHAGAESVGNGAFGIPVDVTDRDALLAAVDGAADRLGGLDGIINNAGASIYGKVEFLKQDAVAQQVNLNFLAQVYGTQAAIPHLRKRGGGRIMNVSSTTVRRYDEFAYISVYSAAKAAVERFTIDMRREVRFDHIAVTLFSPGSTTSSFGSGQDPEVVKEAFAEWFAMGSVYDGSMTPAEVGEAMVSCLDLPEGICFEIVECNPVRPATRASTLELYDKRVDNP